VNSPAVRFVEPEQLGFPVQEVAVPKRLFPYRVDCRHKPLTAVPLLGSGDCLAPWFTDGDWTWYTPNLEPQHGDLVAVDIEFRRLSEDTGERTWLTCVKRYERLHGWMPQLVCNQGAVALSGKTHRILGVITAWRRRHWWKRPAVRNMNFPTYIDPLQFVGRGRPGFPGSHHE
jgi:hypothetical protein